MNKILLSSLTLVVIGVSGGLIIQNNFLAANASSSQTGRVLAEQVTPPSTPSPTATPRPLPPLPTLSAKAYLIVHEDNPTPIIEQNSSVKYPPASTTKIMTALVALQEMPLQQVITIGIPYQVGANIGLQPGEQITIEKLLYGLLLNSGNDAAMALADSYQDGPDQFIRRMNSLAADFNLHDTQFVNPAGLDHPDHFSTAQDLAALAKVAMGHPLFSQIVATKQAIVRSQDDSVVHVLENRNQLLGQLGVVGVKTGYTLTAGEVLVTSVERRSGAYFLVVMGSDNRFQDTRVLIDWLDDYLGTYRIAD